MGSSIYQAQGQSQAGITHKSKQTYLRGQLDIVFTKLRIIITP